MGYANEGEAVQAPVDPWADLQSVYGLGNPPAQGLPAVLPGVQLPGAPQMNTSMDPFNDFMNQINGQIGQAYGYQTPQGQAALMNPNGIPHPAAQQMQISPELQRLIGGEGYNPQILAQMRASAMEAPAQAGVQQMGQMKRALGENGVSGGAAAALRGEVARQTGQAQSQGLRDVDLQNANTSMENTRFGVGQQSAIGMSNMQQANQMAMQNANLMFQALSQNSQQQNSMTQLNTSLQANQRQAGASAQSGFLANQGALGQQQRHDAELQNNQNTFNRQNRQGDMDWERQTKQWDELNKRFSGAQNTLGQWGAQ